MLDKDKMVPILSKKKSISEAFVSSEIYSKAEEPINIQPIYPEIKIKVIKQISERHESLTVKISRKASSAAEEEIYENKLEIDSKQFKETESNPFESQKIEAEKENSLILQLTKDECVFQFNDLEEDIKFSISPTGMATIHEMTSKGTVSAQFPGDVVVSGEIESENISLESQNLILNTPIDAQRINLKAETLLNRTQLNSQDLCINIEKELCNQGIISASQKITVNGNGNIENHSIIKAEQEMKIDVKDLNNHGLMHSNRIEVKAQGFTNDADILSQRFKSKVKKYIHNRGNIVGDKRVILKTRLHSSCEIVNMGKIFSKKDFYAGTYSFLNQGEIASSKACIQGKAELKNLGILAAKKTLVLATHAEIINAGQVFAKKCLLRSEGRKSFFNHENGMFLIEVELWVVLRGIFVNQGCIAVKNERLKISSADTINQENGSITTAKNMQIQTLKDINFSGDIISADTLVTSSFNIKIDSDASVSAEKLSIQALHHFINKGKLSGKQGYFNALFAFLNEGSVNLKGPLQIIAAVVKNSAKIEALGNIEIDASHCIQQLYGAELSSLQAIVLKLGTFYNKGAIKAHNLDIVARTAIKNRGSFIAQKISVKGLLVENLLKGIILAGQDLNIFAEVLNNRGTIEAKQKAELFAELLQNLKNGKILALQELKILAKELLFNYGKISGEKVTLEALQWLLNAGEMSATETLSLMSDRVENESILKANIVIIEALHALRNHPEGKITADERLDMIAKWSFYNEGVLSSLGTLKADVQCILENRNVISSRDALLLINACLIENLGQIVSNNNVSIFAKQVFKNYREGHLSAKNLMTLSSDFVLHNSGQLQAEILLLEAKGLLANTCEASIVASKMLKLSTEGFLINESLMHSEENLEARAKIILNAASGVMSAKQAISLLAQHHLQQDGFIKARSMIISALNLTNKGEVTAEEITLNIQELFKHCEEGRILASDAVTLITKNLLFFGKLQGNANCHFRIHDLFDYSPNTMWIVKQINLMLEAGFNFNMPLNVIGELNIETPRDIGIYTDIKSQGFSVESRNFTVENGGVFSEAKLKAKIEQILKIGKTGTLSSGDHMSLNARHIDYQGKLDALHDLEMIAEDVNFKGQGRVQGNAVLQAPNILFYNNRERASFIVRGNCNFDGDARILYVDFGVGGQFSCTGKFCIRNEATHEYESALERARHKRHIAKLRKVGGIVVVAGFTFVFPPAAFAGAFGKIGAVLVHGAIAGGLGAAVSGDSIVKGTVEGLVFAGFTLGMEHAVKDALKHALKVSVDSILIRSLQSIIVDASKAALETGLHGGKLAQNMLAASMGSVLSQVAVPGSRSGVGQSKLSLSIPQQGLRAAISNTVKGIIKHEKRDQILFASAAAALQSIAAASGEKRFQSIARPKELADALKKQEIARKLHSDSQRKQIKELVAATQKTLSKKIEPNLKAQRYGKVRSSDFKLSSTLQKIVEGMLGIGTAHASEFHNPEDENMKIYDVASTNNDMLTETETMIEYSKAIWSGVVKGGKGLYETILHPWDSMVRPVLDLVQDTMVIAAERLEPSLIDPTSPVADLLILKNYLRKDPSLYQNAVYRMNMRYNSLVSTYGFVSNSSGPVKAEIVSEIATSFLAPGGVVKGFRALGKFMAWEITPTKFLHRRGWWEGYPPQQEALKVLSSKMVRSSPKSHMMYVINHNQDLIITLQPTYYHWDLANGKHVFAAGELFTNTKGRITKINNRSPEYAPQGEHLGQFVEDVFTKNKYFEVDGRFVDWYKENGVKAKPRIMNENSILPEIAASYVGLSSVDLSSHSPERREHSRELLPLYKIRKSESSEVKEKMACKNIISSMRE